MYTQKYAMMIHSDISNGNKKKKKIEKERKNHTLYIEIMIYIFLAVGYINKQFGQPTLNVRLKPLKNSSR